MADDQLTLFNYYRRYRWTAEDFELLQNQLIDGSRTPWEGLSSAAVLDGYTISVNETNLTLLASSGICVGPTGVCGVKNTTTSIDVTAASGSTSGEVKKSLIVVRPVITEDFAIVSPTDPLSTVNLYKNLSCEVVEVEGPQGLNPEYPTPQDNDVVLCGVRLIPGQSALTKNDIDLSVRDILGKNSILHKMLGRFDDRLRPYSISKSVLGIKPSQTESPYPRMFSYISETPSIFPKNSSGNYAGTDTYLDFESGEITGGDDVSADFTPQIPSAGNSIVACVGITQDDILSVSYGLEGTYSECQNGIKNQSSGIAGGVNIVSGVKPLAFVILSSADGSTLSEMNLVDARSTGGGGGASGGGNLVKDVFSGNGVTTDFSLSIAPGAENNTQVYISGVYQSKDNYTLNSQTLSFSTAPPSGTNNIEVISGEPLPLNVPADDSVTTIKLRDQNVTGSKLANASVSVAKLASDVTDLLSPGYIVNGTAEADTAGWTTYQDAAGALPVDGTGAGASVTWTRSTTNPLRGEAHFVFTKDAVNRQGEGVSTEFEIENADLAKVLHITMDYTVLSGTYQSQDLTVYIIEDPNGTPQVIQPAGFAIEAIGSGVQNKLIATFQTSAVNKEYRLCLHVASTSASAYSLAFDSINIQARPQVYGAPITDWQSYTPTFNGLGTPTSVLVYHRRVGSNVQIYGRFAVGNTTATEARMSLPPGLVAKENIQHKVGEWVRNNPSASSAKRGMICSSANSSNLTFHQTEYSVAQTPSLPQNGNNLFTFPEVIWVSAELPIAGWGSSVVMGDSTDSRLVSTRIAKITNQTVSSTAETALTWDNIGLDTHGAADLANNRIVVQVPGLYQISLKSFLSSALNEAFTLRIKLNGNTVSSQASSPPTGESGNSIFTACEANLQAGDVLTATIQSKTDTNYLVEAAINTYLAVTKISSPSTIAATEKILAHYYSTTNQTVSTNTYTKANYSIKEFDTHSAFNSSLNRFVCPSPGYYRATAHFQFAASTSNGLREIALYKNGSLYKSMQDVWTSVNNSGGPGGSVVVECVAGDYLEIFVWQNSEATLNSSAGQARTWAVFERV